MVKRLLDWWYARCRRIDLEILWPSCCAKARDLDIAKAVFAIHAFNDSAWLHLGGQEIIKRIDALEMCDGLSNES